MSASAESMDALQELKIQLCATEEGFEARILDSPFRGYAKTPISLPLRQDELQAFWKQIWQQPVDEAAWRDIGGRLFAALFQGKLGQAYEKALTLTDERLRLRLVLPAEDRGANLLGLVPWESLWNEEERTFLGARRGMPLVRQIDGGNRRVHPIACEGPLRVLPAIASPRGEGCFSVEHEMRQLTSAFAPMVEQRKALILPRPAGTYKELRKALLAHRPHVLHLIAHGGFDDDTGTGFVVLERGDGSQDFVFGEHFMRLLQDVEELRLVVLNSCQTSLQGSFPHLGVTAATIVYSDVPAMVAMQSYLTFEAARSFNHSFYERLAAGDDLDVAMSETRFALARESSQWLLPVLFLSAPDGRLLAGNGASAPPATLSSTGLPSSVAEERPPEPLRLGVRSMSPHTPDLETATHRHLALLEHFDDRYPRDIRNPDLWHEQIYPQLATFLRPAAAETRHLQLYFAAHQSLAFAAGWVLQAKSGLDVSFLQGGHGGPPVPWRPDDDSAPADARLWNHEPEEILDPDAADVALALSVTRPVLPAVRQHLETSGLRVHRLLAAEVAPQAGGRVVSGGEHALRLADAIAHRAMQRTPQERRGTLHLFAAAPNAFLFYLGQLARPFGRIQLYEFGFDDTAHPGEYVPSLVLPPPGD